VNAPACGYIVLGFMNSGGYGGGDVGMRQRRGLGTPGGSSSSGGGGGAAVMDTLSVVSGGLAFLY
jgi:hypothetical protein